MKKVKKAFRAVCAVWGFLITLWGISCMVSIRVSGYTVGLTAIGLLMFQHGWLLRNAED